jgi:all-trans-retinol dehydrogenase (NAD+)
MDYLNLVFHLFVAIGVLLYSSFMSLVRILVPSKYRSKTVKNELILITGAGSGIGRLMAIRFADLGARLVLVDVNQEANELTAAKILANGGLAKAFQCDLSDRDEIYRVANEVKC